MGAGGVVAAFLGNDDFRPDGAWLGGALPAFVFRPVAWSIAPKAQGPMDEGFSNNFYHSPYLRRRLISFGCLRNKQAAPVSLKPLFGAVLLAFRRLVI